jgi:hypothetical protein
VTNEPPEKVKAWIIDYLGAEFSPLEKRDLTELAILAAECARAQTAREIASFVEGGTISDHNGTRHIQDGGFAGLWIRSQYLGEK